jgi:phosphatidyl-myo-inositol dimannoside synthase
LRHLIITNDFPPKTGGIETYILGLCAGLDPSAVTVIAPARAGYQEVDDRLPYSVVRIKRRRLQPSPAITRSVRRTISARKPDAIHLANALPLGRFASRIREQTRVPVTVFAYGSEIIVPSRMPLVRGKLRKVLTSVDLVVVASEFTNKALGEITEGKARTCVVYPSVDPGRFSLAVSGARIRARHNLKDRFVALFVGRLVKRKGAETLVRAIAEMPDAVAVICGGGPEEAALKRLVDELECADRVILAGLVPDAELPEYYAAADVFCMPCSERYRGSDTEGFGIVYIEAAACGLPCVAGVCGGSVEAVVDGETGIILPEPSPRDVAVALGRLAADDTMRARLGAAGRERAETLFSPLTQAAQLEQALGELTG